MSELVESGAECGIDYIVYECIGDYLIAEDIPTVEDVGDLQTVKTHLVALVIESNRFIEKIDNRISEINGV